MHAGLSGGCSPCMDPVRRGADNMAGSDAVAAATQAGSEHTKHAEDQLIWFPVVKNLEPG